MNVLDGEGDFRRSGEIGGDFLTEIGENLVGCPLGEGFLFQFPAGGVCGYQPSAFRIVEGELSREKAMALPSVSRERSSDGRRPDS